MKYETYGNQSKENRNEISKMHEIIECLTKQKL